MKTIRRNAHRKIAAIRASVTYGLIYSGTYSFVSQPIVNMDYVWDQYAKHEFQRLIDQENGTYVIQVHDNLWYVLHTGPAPAPPVDEMSQAPAEAPESAVTEPVDETTELALTVWTVGMEPTMGVMGVWATSELAKAAAEKHAHQPLNWYTAPQGEFRALHDERNPQHCPVWSVAPHVVRDSVTQEG